MTRRCRFCGTEVSFGEQSRATICPRCGEFIFNSLQQEDDEEPMIQWDYPVGRGPMIPPEDMPDVPDMPDASPMMPMMPLFRIAGMHDEDEEPEPELNMDMEKRVEAFQKKRARQQRLLAAGVMVFVLLAVFAVFFAIRFLPEMRYSKALEALESGDYKTAYARFDALKDYRDAKEKRREVGLLLLDGMQVGDTVEFGAYDQDNNPANGKEFLRWRVLAREGDRGLLITQSVIDSRTYDVATVNKTWENCFIRGWLNDIFLVTAFSQQEQDMLISETLPAELNPSYGTNAGSETTDRVFLLSIQELNRYFGRENKNRVAYATRTAAARNVTTSDRTGGASWWLRSPGHSGNYAAVVTGDGECFASGFPDNSETIGVRPAIWIDLSRRQQTQE